MLSDELKDAKPKNDFVSLFFIGNILLVCLFILALLVSFHSHSWMHTAFTFLSYYFILALVALWAGSMINLYIFKKSDALVFLKLHWKGILASFLLATIIFASVPKHFRVLSDETNLLSVAKSMTFNKNVENVTEGRWYYEMYWPTPAGGTEKRPFLFPFLTSITHTLLGYNPNNVFVLNYFVLWGVLFLLYLALHSSLGTIWAISGLILVASQPIIALSATSGSFEMLNLLLIVASFLALKTFLKEPHHKTFIALVLTLLMLANVRYESALFLFIFLLILSLTKHVKFKFFGESLSYGLSLFLLLPLIWQRVLISSESDSNLRGGSWIKAFGYQNAHHNIIQFFKYIFEPSGQLGYAGVVNCIGILSLFLLALLFWFKQKSSAQQQWLIELISAVISLFVLFNIVLFYQGGVDDHPLNGRLYIPILVVLSITPVYFLANILKDKKRLAYGTFICSLAIFIYYHPVAVEDRLSNNLMISREYKFVDDFLKKNGDKNVLVICGRPGQLIVSNYGAISYSTANNQVDIILDQFRNHLYSKIYVVQSINYSNKSPFTDNVIDARYHLETLDEIQIAGSYFFRISQARP